MASSTTTNDASPVIRHDAPVAAPGILDEVAAVCKDQLRPEVCRIDADGVYPTEVMKAFGQAGLYSQHLSEQGIDEQIDMPLAIEAMALVGFECLSTAFCVWCHDACGWYLENTSNQSLADHLKPQIATGEALGATGLSNPMKFYSGIEPLKVIGRRVDGGYVIEGGLPWVSNLDQTHHFGVVFQRDGDCEQRVMSIVRCDHPGVQLRDGGRFLALEGSGTFAIRFRDCFVPDELILADPADDYITAIRPGFVLMQVGMAIGHVRGCADLMHRQDRTHAHINCFLPDSAGDLEVEADEILRRTQRLAETPHETAREFLIDCLQARLDAGELSMRAAHACMLNGGARAYFEKSHHARKLREAYFVGVVTPATKHLRKEIARLTALP